MSGLTKKTVYADKILAHLLGVKEGEHVSYAELSSGLHSYIKRNNLRNLRTAPISLETASMSPPGLQPLVPAAVEAANVKCIYCGAEIPGRAIFCDLCGARQ